MVIFFMFDRKKKFSKERCVGEERGILLQTTWFTLNFLCLTTAFVHLTYNHPKQGWTWRLVNARPKVTMGKFTHQGSQYVLVNVCCFVVVVFSNEVISCIKTCKTCTPQQPCLKYVHEHRRERCH